MKEQTFAQALRSCAATLFPHSGADAAYEARELVAMAAGIKREELPLFREKPFGEEEAAALEKLTRERLAGRPLQYIIGEWGFMGLDFSVDERALIPRQDTETLCEEAIALIRAKGYETCLDMCCGTGCIGVALGALTGIGVTLADISAPALSLAEENCKKNGVAAKTVQSDLFAEVNGCYDIIASNPPYLTCADMRALQTELEREPQNALFGGADGLDFYRRLSLEAPGHINAGGALLLEVGAGQADEVMAMLPSSRAVRDINGIERVIVWEKR